MEFKDRVKSVLSDAAINFLRGAANGFAFTMGAQLAKTISDRSRGTSKCERKCDSRISCREKNVTH